MKILVPNSAFASQPKTWPRLDPALRTPTTCTGWRAGNPINILGVYGSTMIYRFSMNIFSSIRMTLVTESSTNVGMFTRHVPPQGRPSRTGSTIIQAAACGDAHFWSQAPRPRVGSSDISWVQSTVQRADEIQWVQWFSLRPTVSSTVDQHFQRFSSMQWKWPCEPGENPLSLGGL